MLTWSVNVDMKSQFCRLGDCIFPRNTIGQQQRNYDIVVDVIFIDEEVL